MTKVSLSISDLFIICAQLICLIWAVDAGFTKVVDAIDRNTAACEASP